MHKLATLALATGALYIATLGCGCDASEPSAEVHAAASQTATFQVEGMTCASCSVTVRTAVGKLDGIGTVEVDVAAGTATVAFDPDKTTPSAIARAITGSGYTATASTEGV